MTRAKHSQETRKLLAQLRSGAIGQAEYQRQVRLLSEELLESGQTQTGLFDDPVHGPPPPEAFQ